MAQVGVSAHAADEGLEGRGVRPRELGDDVGDDFWEAPLILWHL
jgi:hypothetical protein